MYFDKEQWAIIGDSVPATYFGVIGNTVLVCPRVGAKYRVCIRVPSRMFSFIKEALKLDADKLKNKQIRFYLEEDLPGEWALVLATLALTVAIDLWPYKGLPNWAVRSRCL